MPGMQKDTAKYTCRHAHGDNETQKGQILIHLGTHVMTLGGDMKPCSWKSPNVDVVYATVVPSRELGLGVLGGSNCMLRC